LYYRSTENWPKIPIKSCRYSSKICFAREIIKILVPVEANLGRTTQLLQCVLQSVYIITNTTTQNTERVVCPLTTSLNEGIDHRKALAHEFAHHIFQRSTSLPLTSTSYRPPVHLREEQAAPSVPCRRN
jgi:hypothetical protein